MDGYRRDGIAPTETAAEYQTGTAVERAAELGREHGVVAGANWIAQRDHWERDGFSYQVPLPEPDLSAGDVAELLGIPLPDSVWDERDEKWDGLRAYETAFTAAVEATIRDAV